MFDLVSNLFDIFVTAVSGAFNAVVEAIRGAAENQ